MSEIHDHNSDQPQELPKRKTIKERVLDTIGEFIQDGRKSPERDQFLNVRRNRWQMRQRFRH